MENKIEKLVSKYKESDSITVRASIAEELGRLNSTDAVKPLIEMLEDDDIFVRAHVVNALANIGTVAVPVLLQELSNPKNFIRKNIAKAIGEIKSADTVDHLLKMLMFNENDKEVLLEIIISLGKIGDDRAVLPLCEMLKVEDWEIQFRTINALGRISSPKAVEKILPFVNSKNEDLVWAALMAIEEIKEISPKPVIDRIEEMRKQIISKDEQLILSMEETKDWTIVKLKGNFFAFSTRKFEEFISPLIDKSGKNLILDFKECTFIDSFALGALNKLRINLGKVNLKVKIISCPEEIKSVFATTHLLSLFEIT